jgi:hypothetical protein
MKKETNIDELFRNKLQDFEQEPPAYLLDRVLSGVAESKRKKRLIFWRVTGIAAALMIAFVAGWQISQMSGDKQMAAGIETVAPLKDTLNTSLSQAKEERTLAETAVTEKVAVVASKNVKSEKAKIGGNRLDQNQDVAFIPGSQESRREAMSMLKSKSYKPAPENAQFAILSVAQPKIPENELGLLSVDEQIIRQNQQSVMADNNDAKDKRRWSVGAQVSPVYNVSKSSHAQAYAANMLNESNSNPVELGGGLSVAVKTGKRLSIQSGIYYSALEQSSGNSVHARSSDMYAGVSEGFLNTNVSLDAKTNKMSINSTAGVIEFNGVPRGVDLGTSPEDKMLSSTVVVSDVKMSQSFEYIEIPVYLRYTILDKRFGVEMMGGLSSNVLVGNQVSMQNASGSNVVGETADMQSVSYSGSLGLGFKYGLSKRFFLNVEPRIKYYLNSLNSNSSVSYKPYTIGVYTGLSYQF